MKGNNFLVRYLIWTIILFNYLMLNTYDVFGQEVITQGIKLELKFVDNPPVKKPFWIFGNESLNIKPKLSDSENSIRSYSLFSKF